MGRNTQFALLLGTCSFILVKLLSFWKSRDDYVCDSSLQSSLWSRVTISGASQARVFQFDNSLTRRRIARRNESLRILYIALTIVSRCFCAMTPTWQLSALDRGLILHSTIEPLRFWTTTDRNSPHSLVEGWLPRARAPFVRILLNASLNSVLKML